MGKASKQSVNKKPVKGKSEKSAQESTAGISASVKAKKNTKATAVAKPDKRRPAKKNTTGIATIKKPKPDLYADLSKDNPKHARIFRFIDEYPIDTNGTQAAIRAGYAANSADVTAAQLLANPKVKKLVDEKLAEIAKRNGVDQDYVLNLWKSAAEVDVNELVEFRRRCCRHCWGTEFVYMETLSEHRRRQHQYEIDNQRAEEQKKDLPVWDDTIELGFNGTKPPNPDCPECWGEGKGRAFFKDTVAASPAAKAIYAGVKEGKDGLEVKMVSKEKAYEALSRHVGFYNQDDSGKTRVIFDNDKLEQLYWNGINKSIERQKEVDRERGYIDMEPLEPDDG